MIATIVFIVIATVVAVIGLLIALFTKFATAGFVACIVGSATCFCLIAFCIVMRLIAKRRTKEIMTLREYYLRNRHDADLKPEIMTFNKRMAKYKSAIVSPKWTFRNKYWLRKMVLIDFNR